MLNRFALPFFTAALVVLSTALPATVLAQMPFTLDVKDSTAVVRGDQLIDMKVLITNTQSEPIDVRAVRFRNELPDSDFYTAICFGAMCYPPEMDTPPAARIGPGETVEFKLSVGTNRTDYEVAEVRTTIRFDTGVLSDYTEQDFRVTFDGTASAPAASFDAALAAWPNPARTSATVPLSANEIAGGVDRVLLVDALGRTVIDLRDVTETADGVRLDVTSVPDGAYFYRVDAGGASRTGRVVVAH